MKHFAIQLIRWYQKSEGFWYPLVAVPPQCKFYPTCSEYAVQVIERRGVVAGGIKAFARVCRCHPFSAGGIHLPS